MENITSTHLRMFIEHAKQYLINSFREQTSTGDLTKVYPIEIQSYPYEKNKYPTDITPSDYLGALYEQIIPKRIKKDLGKFYTRDNTIINSMFENTSLLEGKILEPSCGSGLILVNIVERIVATLKERGSSSAEIIDYIQSNIYGNDTDPIALQICEINIIAALLPEIVDAYYHDDSLRVKKFNLTMLDFTQKHSFSNDFSLVIGNPPFVTMYGKRSRNMTEDKRAYFNTFDFVQNKNGNNKFNTSMFFVENGLHALKKGGKLIYILDIAFFETAYIDLRKYIIQHYFINTIKKGFSVFDGVASGQIIVEITNRDSSNHCVKFLEYETNVCEIVDQSIWNNTKNKYKIFVPLTSYAKTINDKMMVYPKLDHFFPGKALRTCCALTGKTEEFIVDPHKDCAHEIFPYIEGSKGLKQKFGKLTPYRHIKFDYELQLRLSDEFKQELSSKGVKNKKRVTLGDREAYRAPKIFIRQSSQEIIATYTEKPYAANNSIYILTNKKYAIDDTNLLKYVCGILNSDLITYFCRINRIIRMENGKTPQIKTSDLKEIRICIDHDYFDSIISFVDALQENPSDKMTFDSLNNTVYQIYNISVDEQNNITDYLSKK